MLHISRQVPENCYLNISLRDAETDEILLEENGSEPELTEDLFHIAPFRHPSVYLHAEIQGDGSNSPLLHGWAMNWIDGIPKHWPKLDNEIENISFEEDSSKEIDLHDFFTDINTPPLHLLFSIENFDSEPRIETEINDSMLLFRSTVPNWTGGEHFEVTCTNEMGLWEKSNIFKVNVTEVDDRPMWTHSIPDVIFEEDGNSTPLDLRDHVVDAEKDDFMFRCDTNDRNVTIEIKEKIMTIYPTENWSGNATVDLTVAQADNESLFSTTTFNVTVIPINDPPCTTLLFPDNESESADTKIRLSWSVEDNDGPGEITYRVFLSRFLSEVKDRYEGALYSTHNNFLNLDLDYGVYYWTVIAHDGIEYGECDDDYYRFIIESESSVPDVELYFPVDGSKVNSTNITLKWHCPGQQSGIEYELHLGSSSNWTAMQVINVAGTGAEDVEYTVTNLTNGETYYWYVLARMGKSTGRCISGTWKFTVDLDYERIVDIKIESDTSRYEVKPDNNYNFNFTLRNLGTEEETIALECQKGIFQGELVVEPEQITLKAGENTTFRLRLGVPPDIILGNYDIKLLATVGREKVGDYTFSHLLNISVAIEKEENVTGPPEEKPSWKDHLGEWFLEYWELSIAVISGLVFLFGYLRLKKRKGKFQSLRRQIDHVCKNLSDRPEEAIITLESISSNLTNFMDREEITDNQYMILERKINDFILDFRGSARLIKLRTAVKHLPATVRQRVVEILEDGRVTKEEFDSFTGLLGKEKLTESERNILGEFMGQWLKEDTGEDVDDEEDSPGPETMEQGADGGGDAGNSVNGTRTVRTDDSYADGEGGRGEASSSKKVKIPLVIKGDEATRLFSEEDDVDADAERGAAADPSPMPGYVGMIAGDEGTRLLSEGDDIDADAEGGITAEPAPMPGDKAEL